MKTYNIKNFLLFSFILIALVFLPVACSPAPTPTASDSPTTPTQTASVDVKPTPISFKGETTLYVVVPLTGFQANAGQTVLGGVRTAVADVNNSGGVLGKKVVVEALDDMSDSDTATTLAQKILDDKKSGKDILGVIGNLNSGQTKSTLDVLKDTNIIVITPTASEDDLASISKLFFRVNANDTTQAKKVADFIASNGGKNVAVVHNDSSYGVGLGNSIKDDLSKIEGVKVVAFIEVKEGQDSFAKELEQLKAANPDYIFYGGYEIETPYLREALMGDESMKSVPMIASDGAFLSATIDNSNGTSDGLMLSAFAPHPYSLENNKAFLSLYTHTENKRPDTYSVNGYVAAQVLLDAATKANSTDSTTIADFIRNNSFKTIIGTLSFSQDGNVKDSQIFFYIVKNGEFEALKP